VCLTSFAYYQVPTRLTIVVGAQSMRIAPVRNFE
jgi:hypothetical protein